MGSGSGLLAWLRRAAGRAAAAGIALLLAGLALLAAAAPGSASGKPNPGVLGIAGKFGLNPAPGPQGQAASYFQLSIAPSQAATATIVVSNLADKTQTLVLGRALGTTAGNGGAAYQATVKRCSGPSCWVTGLPSRVTLPADDRESLAFTVRRPAQDPARPVPERNHGRVRHGIKPGESRLERACVSAGDHRRLGDVGVAVTVGNPSALLSRLSVHSVQGADEGSVARLNISMYNTGQTFAGGNGQVSCQAAGRQHSYRVYANTVLPGDHDVVAVNAPGLPEGATAPCTIQLRYGADPGPPLVRHGGHTFPPPAQAHCPHRPRRLFRDSPTSGIPIWAITLIVLGGLILISLWGMVLLRRQRSRKLSDPASD